MVKRSFLLGVLLTISAICGCIYFVSRTGTGEGYALKYVIVTLALMSGILGTRLMAPTSDKQ